MQGDARVIEFLNEQLTAELTAINQYFLHAKMQENWGWTKLAKHTRHESIDEMRHAEILTDRILFLDGLPNYQRLFAAAHRPDRARRCSSATCRSRSRRSTGSGAASSTCARSATSRRRSIFEDILADEEHHIDYLETQLELIETARRAALPAERHRAPGGVA